MEAPEIHQDTAAWIFFVHISFALSVFLMSIGIWLLPVNLWIVYEGPNGLEYSGYGNWTYQPGESSFAAYGSQNLRPINANILFYADSTDGSVNWAGDRGMDFNGRTLAMRKADISTDGAGNYVMELNCSSS